MAHAPPTTSFQTYLGVDEKKKVLLQLIFLLTQYEPMFNVIRPNTRLLKPTFLPCLFLMLPLMEFSILVLWNISMILKLSEC